ncbi:related to regulator of mitochondrial iron homeostasis [Phialocephala subalpina]|uniref:ferroxidase n=1 Tax=Phialocephala subalpina TaxID=576137 RepID=A0A1L7WI97_9HELO|nr:related to regulator of mitochondrial iron homeostasis [Phialocephala subalpina]
MSSRTASKLALRAIRQILPSSSSTRLSQVATKRLLSTKAIPGPRVSIVRVQATNSINSAVHARSFHASRPNNKGLSPESEEPPAKGETEGENVAAAAEISAEKYHELADDYMNALLEKLEALQEETEAVDVEYSAGVLTLTFPPNGTYVINKQPPNKQIWLSSPITGPKRYDYVMLSEGQDSKEGTGQSEWMYLRDGSTLTELLQTEVGVDMSNLYAPIPHRGD